LNLLFSIQSINAVTADADLYIEIDAQGFSYIIMDKGTSIALVIYQFEAGTTNETAADFIHRIINDQPVLQQKFNSVHIIYGYAQSMLVPQAFVNSQNSNALLGLLYGDGSDRVVKNNFIQKHAMQNVYSIPSVVEMVLTGYFETAQFTHLYSLLPDVVKKSGNNLYCIFSTGQLKMILMKEDQLQLIQNFCYKTPEDAAYYLLNSCKSFEVNVSEINLSLSGMIDVKSALYKELYKYFLLLEFDKLPDQYEYPGEMNQYPAHYFSHLFSIAACV
jgi:Protein of unknown function (DUF3822)